MISRVRYEDTPLLRGGYPFLIKKDVLDMKWIARSVGLLASIYWSIALIGSFISDKGNLSLDGLVLGVMIAVAVSGFLLA